MAPEFAGRLTLFATAAAILGGLGRVDGALVGGMLLGIVNGITQAIDPHWFNVVQFAVLLLVLTALPQGLIGARAGRIGAR
jgi:branched-chain amino acid transport system permease protein